jgi:DNA repair exonuclease SbcCD ATPase subunit
MTVQEITQEFVEAKARHGLLKQDLDIKLNQILYQKEQVEYMVKARWVLTEVATQTQKRFKEKVETLVTMAIRSVFDRPFQFLLGFERKRNKMECKPEIKELVNGKYRTFDPSEDMGGGMVDIISFALRVVLWSLEKPRSRAVIVFDEPMKNLGKMVSLAGQVLKEISHKLNFQLIIITHEDELIEIADRAYYISHDGNKSHVELVKGELVNATKKARIVRGS